MNATESRKAVVTGGTHGMGPVTFTTGGESAVDGDWGRGLGVAEAGAVA